MYVLSRDYYIKIPSVFSGYAPWKIKQPSSLPLLSDTLCTDGKMLWNFFAQSFAEGGVAAVWLGHSKRANTGFSDGHVSSMDCRQLNKSPLNITRYIDENRNKITYAPTD